MSTKKDHLQFLKEHGSFKVDCSLIIFNDEEIEFLEKYGHWLTALQNGTLEPVTELQEEFIKVMNHGRQPFSVEEKAWFKYINRKRIEKEKGDKLSNEYRYEEQGFYTRDMKKQMNKVMFSEMHKNHGF